MVIKPMVRNNICLNSHPAGCAAVVERQIEYVLETLGGGCCGSGCGDCCRNAPEGVPKLVLVVGCSTGYGLASRITAAFGYGAATVGVSLEKPASDTKPGTPGYYNNLAFDKEARNAGLVSITLDGDAYSNEVKAHTAQAIRKAAQEAGIPAKIDLVVYSLASPVRVDPATGVMHRSVIKPIGKPFTGKTVDMMSGAFGESGAEPATAEEIANTVKVMGGEDWELWMDALAKEDLLSPHARTVAYTYIGPELSWAIYKNGTIGKAKEDLERAGREINKKHGSAASGKIAGAWVSVNKAVVTRASSVIPIIPFYISTLFKVMKEMNLHEGCIEQIVRLYRDRLYTAEAIAAPKKTLVDSENRIRIDDWEMRDDVQKETSARMQKATAENLESLSDIAGFRRDFLEVHGFAVEGVDYDAEVDPSGV
ncbi:MAG: trans-2-enoyl-CoA reductase family protein [Treponema sp.]|nr:trans-2-enoyl-CoA reductase family protein [Treponema sp.]